MKIFGLKAKFEDKNFQSEIYRKAFHIGLGSFLILAYFYLGKEIAIMLFTSLLFLAILSDAIRLRVYIQYPLKRIADTISRSYERTYLGAHTYFLSGVLFSSIFFHEIPFLIGVFVVTFIDPIISLVGMIFNQIKHPYNKNKSVIGSFFGAILTFFVLLNYTSILKASIIAITVYIIDSVPLPYSDNLVYPILISFLAESL
jgi:dolichol kinase